MAKIKIREIKTGDIIEREVIDAKECVGGGLYEYVGKKPAGDSAVTPEALKREASAKEKGEAAMAEGEEEFDLDSIDAMNTAELDELVAKKELVIENWEKLNLRKKRAAVIEALTPVEEEENE